MMPGAALDTSGQWAATSLIAAVVVGIAVVIALISLLKVHPFIALIAGSATVGLMAGMGASETTNVFLKSFGGTVSSTGILIALGAMLGKLLADSGGAHVIVETIIGRVTLAALPWALCLVAFLLSLPLFFEVAVVLIMPIVLLIAKQSGQSTIRLGVPALASISLLNGFLLPHPGPLTAVAGLHADFGTTLLLGFVIAIPTVIIGGPLLGNLLDRHMRSPEPPADLVPASMPMGGLSAATRRPRFGWALATILLPVLLMIVKTLVDLMFDKHSGMRAIGDAVGQPMIALLAGLVMAHFTLGAGGGLNFRQISESTGRGLPAIASIVFIVGAGGGFGGVLVASGVSKQLGILIDQLGLPVYLLGWLITALVRIAVGSGTVSIVTAVGLLAPVTHAATPLQSALIALSIGAGSRFFSHVNDAGFWLVKEYMGFSVKETFKVWTLLDCVISVVALIGVMIVDVVAG
ncbi:MULTISPECIES: GntT/GntP/DsdX family permease [Cupriavidus]